jgi:hypothetical protein
MNHREVDLWLITTILTALFLNSCAPPASTLPDHGVYLIAGGRRVALPLFAGGLDSIYFPTMPDVRDSSPRILYWQLDEDIDTLTVQNVTQDSQIEFQTKPLAGGGIELVLDRKLERGLYCVVQYASSLPSADIPHWCFSVGGAIDAFLESKSATEQAEIAARTTQIAQAEAAERNAALVEKIWQGSQGEEIRDVIRAAQSNFYQAYRQRDASLLAAVFTPDATITSPTRSRPFTTTTAIRHFIDCQDSPTKDVSTWVFSDSEARFTDKLPPEFYSEERVRVYVEYDFVGTPTLREIYCKALEDENLYPEAGGRFELFPSHCYYLRKTSSGWRVEHINWPTSNDPNVPPACPGYEELSR